MSAAVVPLLEPRVLLQTLVTVASVLDEEAARSALEVVVVASVDVAATAAPPSEMAAEGVDGWGLG
jgi:hypothetical protein